MKTGWPAHLLQDDSRKLSDWFASRVDARWTVRQVCAEIERKRMNTQPEALRVADAIADRRDWYEFDPSAWCPKAAALIRTQHADLERKDALLRQALEALCLPCDRWNKGQSEIVNAAISAAQQELAK